MLRAWLILVSVLVHLLLFIAFILFYLHPHSYQHLEKITLSPLHNKAKTSIIKNDKIKKEKRIKKKPVLKIVKKIDLFKTSLTQRLKQLSVKRGDPIFIRIFKKEAVLEVWVYKNGAYKHLKDYYVCAASGHLGPKLKEGDKQSPEGFYRVKKHQLNPHSRFHLSFNLGYPNQYDRSRKRTGSYLMVHGNCVSVGCYAMTDEKIEEIYALVESALKHGQKYINVHAFPFRMTRANMYRYQEHKWYDFWVNLKEGYDYFEAEKLPPLIKVEKRQYTIYEANQ